MTFQRVLNIMLLVTLILLGIGMATLVAGAAPDCRTPYPQPGGSGDQLAKAMGIPVSMPVNYARLLDALVMAKPEGTRVVELMDRYNPTLPDRERWEIAAAVFNAAERQGVDPLLVASVIAAESGFKHRLPDGKLNTSKCGARGIMQLNTQYFQTGDDMAENIASGTAYLANMLQQFGREDLAVAGYNAGPGVAQKALRGYSETRWYVRRVMLTCRGLRGVRR